MLSTLRSRDERMKKVFLSCLCFISIVSYGIELRQADQSGIDLIFGYEYGKPDGNIFYSPKHALTFVPYNSKSEDRKRCFSIWMFRNDEIRFENIIGQVSMRSVDDAEVVLQLDSSYDTRVSEKGKETAVDTYLFHKRLAMVAASFMPGEWKTQRWESITYHKSQWVLTQKDADGKLHKTTLTPTKSTNTMLFQKITLPQSFAQTEFLKIKFNAAPVGIPQKYGNGYWIRFEDDRVFYYFDDADFAWCIGFDNGKIVMVLRGDQQRVEADFHNKKKFGKIFYQRTPFQLYMTRYETDNKYGLEFKLNPWDSKQLFTVSTCDLLKE